MSAKDLFYPESKKFSHADEKAFAREELVYNVTEDILLVLEDMEISKKELARRLGKSRSYISQILSGARNMTLGSLSDICVALDVKPNINLASTVLLETKSQSEPIQWEQPKKVLKNNVVHTPKTKVKIYAQQTSTHFEWRDVA
jgi:transcriptional regulator with XRE-family HTH domain